MQAIEVGFIQNLQEHRFYITVMNILRILIMITVNTDKHTITHTLVFIKMTAPVYIFKHEEGKTDFQLNICTKIV